MAEYLLVDASMVRVLPAGLPLRRAALAEPLGVGLHGIARAGGVRGQRGLVAGAGAVGLVTAGAALAVGAGAGASTGGPDGPVLPAGLPLRRAALAEPLGVGLHGIARAGGVRGQRVLVAGAGAIGLLTAGAALALEAESVTSTDVLDGPLQRARGLGVTRAVNVAEEHL